MNETKNYTAADIERYHRGELSAAEMHDLEAAALTDPFLADALDGYVFTKTPAADLSSLRQKLQQRIEKKEERKGVFLMNTRWMRAAAAFIVLAGAGWLAFTILNPKQEDVAAAKIRPSQDFVTAAPMPDSSAVVYNNPPATFSSPQEDEAVQRSAEAYSAPVPTYRREVLRSTPSLSQTIDTNAIAAEAAEAKARLDSYVAGGADTKTQTEIFFTKEKNTDSINNLNIVLRPNNLPVDQVVVNRSKRAAGVYDIRKRGNVVIDTLEPAEGWTNYDDYIASNIKQPEELNDKPVRGEVELSFDVNKEGEATNIAVVKSLCEKCDKEAIRLLKEGPKWKKAAKKGRIKIAF